MKLLLLLILFTIAAYTTKAQLLEEWTSQKQTQIKYLLQQMAALHVYAESTLKGYKIAKQGLATIQYIKDGDLHLHLDRIISLKQVNPAVQGYAKMMIVRAMQATMIKQYTNTLSYLKQSKELNKDDRNYYQHVCNMIIQQGIENLTALTQLITDNYFEMTDDERVRRIDSFYDDMQDKWAFLESFNNDMKSLCLQLSKEKEDVKTMQILYGVK